MKEFLDCPFIYTAEKKKPKKKTPNLWAFLCETTASSEIRSIYLLYWPWSRVAERWGLCTRVFCWRSVCVIYKCLLHMPLLRTDFLLIPNIQVSFFTSVCARVCVYVCVCVCVFSFLFYFSIFDSQFWHEQLSSVAWNALADERSPVTHIAKHTIRFLLKALVWHTQPSIKYASCLRL